MADHLIRMPKERVRSLTEAITDARENVHFCRECYTLTDSDMCPVCSDENRDHSVIMVVEDTRDMQAYEKTGRYTGVYHVLQGAMSPMLGIGPNDLLNDLATAGLLFENLCVRDLRVYAEAIGGKVFHYRDKSNLECDAVVHLKNGRYGLIEIKLGGDKLIEEGAKNLRKLYDRIDHEKMNEPAFMMVLCGVAPFAQTPSLQ